MAKEGALSKSTLKIKHDTNSNEKQFEKEE
jgi:hypothetical protein